MISRRNLIIFVVVAVALVIVASIGFMLLGGTSGQQETPTPTPVIGVGSQDIPFTATPLPTSAPTQAPAAQQPEVVWRCVMINSPDWSSFDRSKPVVPNAYRAILAAGGGGPPYKLVYGNGSRQVQSLDQLNLVFNGNQVCVDP